MKVLTGYNDPQYAKLKKAFQAVVRGANIMTPELVGYAKIPNGVVEISTGTKFLGLELYGITVVQDNRKADSLCKCCNSMEEVNAYIQELNKKA